MEMSAREPRDPTVLHKETHVSVAFCGPLPLEQFVLKGLLNVANGVMISLGHQSGKIFVLTIQSDDPAPISSEVLPVWLVGYIPRNLNPNRVVVTSVWELTETTPVRSTVRVLNHLLKGDKIAKEQ
jgi:phospholipid N-methyltransferase